MLRGRSPPTDRSRPKGAQHADDHGDTHYEPHRPRACCQRPSGDEEIDRCGILVAVSTFY